MNWKEEYLDLRDKALDFCIENNLITISEVDLKAFIQSQFEKLIDDLESNPDPSIGHPITIPFWIELKQTQLRKKWL